MQTQARVYWLPKAGNRRSEYEDAFAPVRPSLKHGTTVRYAIGDGATETSFSRLWARQLVRGWIRGSLDTDRLETFLPHQQARWLRSVRSRPLPWYAEEKVQSGAYAAFLGLQLSTTDENTTADFSWRAVSIGDCCLFHLRGERLLTTFPATDTAFFTSRPYLLSSHPQRNELLQEHLTTGRGDAIAGDSFLLMTDALAHCFFVQMGNGATPWSSLVSAECFNQRHFRKWIEALRSQGNLRNDDVTLYIIQSATPSI